jgi:hypothetical protein
MSPPPPAAPVDPDSGKDIVQTIKEGGFTASIIGIAGMVARLLLSDGKMSVGGAIRHVLAAGIVAYFVDQGLYEQEMSRGLKVACIGISGATATEIVEFVVKWVKAKGSSEVSKLKSKDKADARRKK